MTILKKTFEYIKQGKFEELMVRGRIFVKGHYGNLKYDLINKISKDKYKITTVNKSKMYIHLDDDGISKQLYLYKKREKFATEFFKSFLNEEDTILEIGANIGYYVLLENKIANNGKIFAFEPLLFNRKLLNMNVKLNDVNNIEIFPFALGDQNKEQKFYIYKKRNWSSFNKNIKGEIVSSEIVKTITIDDFVEEYLGDTSPTVLRMDVEGYEYEVIKGATNTIASCNNLKIFMEIHSHILPQEKIDDLLNILKDNKFKIKAIIKECPPILYPYLSYKIWDSIDGDPYGYIGNSYDDLKKYLRRNKALEVFFEKVDFGS